MIPVNPAILVWARETAGLTIPEAARKIQIVEHKLEEIELGKILPSRPVLLRMAKQYRRPPITFYLEAIPTPSNYGIDFRGQSRQYFPKEKALVSALLRYAKCSQQLIKSTLELEEENENLPFVGELRQKWALPSETPSMEHELQQMPRSKYKNLIQYALDSLQSVLSDQCTSDQYYAQPNKGEAFKLLRSSCERSGIFVIQKNNLGSWHSQMSTDLFGAFVISDEVAPLIVINCTDPALAMSFSLLHEIVHLLLDQTGISDSKSSTPCLTTKLFAVPTVSKLRPFVLLSFHITAGQIVEHHGAFPEMFLGQSAFNGGLLLAQPIHGII